MTTTTPATKSVTPATKPATKSAGAATPVKKVSVKKVVAAPVVVDVKEEAETDASEAKDDTKSAEQALLDSSAELFAKIQQMGAAITSMKTDFRALEKRWVRELKTAQKASKRKRPVGDRPPSGFAKPGPISDTLAEFIGVEKGTDIARIEVTKLITKYIKDNKLQGEKDGRDIFPDEKLKSLLNIDPATNTEQLGFFNIQKHMSQHFPKKAAAVAAA